MPVDVGCRASISASMRKSAEKFFSISLTRMPHGAGARPPASIVTTSKRAVRRRGNLQPVGARHAASALAGSPRERRAEAPRIACFDFDEDDRVASRAITSISPPGNRTYVRSQHTRIFEESNRRSSPSRPSRVVGHHDKPARVGGIRTRQNPRPMSAHGPWPLRHSMCRGWRTPCVRQNILGEEPVEFDQEAITVHFATIEAAATLAHLASP